VIINVENPCGMPALELPDLRIEYETEDGRRAHRDVELVTDQHWRGQLGGKPH
jgi:hypothetical protein